MLLITTERNGKYVIQPGKKPTPVLLLDAITDVKAEMKSATERIRTTLCIEIGDIEDLEPGTYTLNPPGGVSASVVIE